jgi:probable F420-dependent oxidoreductase
MDFAITFKPDMPIDRILRLAQQAESAGFSYTWLFDSHVLWMEPFPLMALIAASTKKMRIGTCVTNPAVRDVTVTSSLFATLNLASNGRMEMGIGRGDSSRRVLGKKPTTLEYLEEFVRTFRELNAGKSVDYEGVPTRFPWATAGVPRVWVAGYGPKALRTAGKIGDGVILQFADPDLIDWCMGFVREGAREAGRDPGKIQVMSAAPVWVSDDLAKAREHVRWFPALVSNHVVDLVSRYKPEELPASLTSFIRNRTGYNYLHHAEVGSDNANFVTDEIVDRFCIVGPASAHRKKLSALRAVGVTQFNIYLMSGDEEQTLDLYHREILAHQ